MTDPAAEAAHRALVTCGTTAQPWVAEAGAREMARPIRDLSELRRKQGRQHHSPAFWAGVEWILASIDELIYTSEELKR